MTEAEWTLVDARQQVKAALEGMHSEIAFDVRQSWPREQTDRIVITYSEYDNRSTDCPVVDALTYQIDIWCFDRETAVELAGLVNRAMLELGLKRTYMSEVMENGVFQRKTMRFGRKIDKRWMRLMD